MPSAKCGGFKDEEVGKFLVLRRDGSIPTWTWFVLGARDPHAPTALRAYADSIMNTNCDNDALRAYAIDVIALAHKLDLERTSTGDGDGDPEAGPHRKDNPLVLDMMCGKLTFDEICEKILALEEARCAAVTEHADCAPKVTARMDRSAICEMGNLLLSDDKQCYSSDAVVRMVKVMLETEQGQTALRLAKKIVTERIMGKNWKRD